ncbi:MAG: SDR family oxidoreductase [Steroidobacteraceae bacterium]|nr:SDR family oxidoreductase [Steroidobacteraceae bacterium]MDW8259138.1 SDR family oxidoreductase [Gammaproteobacteria bacterium]
MRWRKTWIFLALLIAAVAGLYVAGREPTRTPAPIAPLAAHGNFSGPIFVVGGTRGTGLEIVRIMRRRGDRVAALVRPGSDAAALEQLGVRVILGDALNPADLAAAFASERFAAVVSTLGTRSRDERRPDFEGNRNLFEAAKTAGVRRVVLVTVIGAGDSEGTGPWLARRFLARIIALKTQAEDALRGSGLDYTIIRPGGLIDRPAERHAFLTEDRAAFSWITRSDLAELTVRALDDPQTVNKVYHAFDPTRTRFWSIFQQIGAN